EIRPPGLQHLFDEDFDLDGVIVPPSDRSRRPLLAAVPIAFVAVAGAVLLLGHGAHRSAAAEPPHHRAGPRVTPVVKAPVTPKPASLRRSRTPGTARRSLPDLITGIRRRRRRRTRPPRPRRRLRPRAPPRPRPRRHPRRPRARSSCRRRAARRCRRRRRAVYDERMRAPTAAELELYALAEAAIGNAYAPYSRFPVSAALQPAGDGEPIVGV